jgi:hypothetical protein
MGGFRGERKFEYQSRNSYGKGYRRKGNVSFFWQLCWQLDQDRSDARSVKSYSHNRVRLVCLRYPALNSAPKQLGFNRLFMTHPPLDERIARLRATQ